VFRADAFACPAAGAFFFIHHRQSLRSHGYGIKGACFGAGAQAQAADGAHFHTPAQQRHRTTIIQPLINILQIGILHTEITSRQSDIRLFGLNLDSHNFGDGFSHLGTGSHTGIGRGYASHNRFRIGAATRQPAAASVGARQCVFDSLDLGVHVNIKNFRRQSQYGTDYQTHGPHQN